MINFSLTIEEAMSKMNESSIYLIECAMLIVWLHQLTVTFDGS